MSETGPVAAPTVSAPSAEATAKKLKKAKKMANGSKAHKPVGPRLTKLTTKAVSASKECKGLSLGMLKKAAGSYDGKKNNSHIKLGIKRLISNNTLVQTKGTAASGSFKLNKKPGKTKEKATKKKPDVKPKKLVAKKPASVAKKPKKKVVLKKSPKKVKKGVVPAAKKVAKSPKKAAKAGRPKKAETSLAKAKVVKPKAAKPKATKPKAAKAKEAAPKKK